MKILNNAKQGETFRFISWNWSSEDKNVALFFKGESKDSTLIKFSIKEGCLNAGKLNLLGKSVYDWEVETLIPPYSVWYVQKKLEGEIELDLKNSKDYNYDMDGKY